MELCIRVICIEISFFLRLKTSIRNGTSAALIRKPSITGLFILKKLKFYIVANKLKILRT